MQQKFGLWLFLVILVAACSPVRQVLTSTPIPLTLSVSTPTSPKVIAPAPTVIPSPTVDEFPTLSPTTEIVLTPSLLSTLSPGQYLAYESAKRPPALYLLSTNGALQGQLISSDDHTIYGFGDVSPDHTHLIVKADPSWALTHLEQPLSLQSFSEAPCFSASWSPQGDQLVMTCQNGDAFEVFLFSLADQTVIQLTACHDPPFLAIPGSCLWPVWSPNGNWIVYMKDTGCQQNSGEDGLYLMKTACLGEPMTCAQSTVQTFVSFDCGESYTLAWAPDSQSVALQRQHLQPASIQIISVSTGKVEATHLIPMTSDGRDQYVYSMAWSPDGRWIAYTLSESPFEIFIIAPDTGETQLFYTDAEHGAIVAFWLTIP